jgi:hypothetical protein
MTEVLLLVFIGVMGAVAIIGLVTRARLAELKLKRGVTMEGEQMEKILAETVAEVTRLKERVIVLEKLVTDDDRKLADEIARLRGGGPEARS